MWMEQDCDTSNYSVSFSDQKSEVVPVTQARRWEEFNYHSNFFQKQLRCLSNTQLSRFERGGEKNKGPLLLLSLGQLTLSAMLCPDGVASLPGAEDPL